MLSILTNRPAADALEDIICSTVHPAPAHRYPPSPHATQERKKALQKGSFREETVHLFNSAGGKWLVFSVID